MQGVTRWTPILKTSSKYQPSQYLTQSTRCNCWSKRVRILMLKAGPYGEMLFRLLWCWKPYIWLATRRELYNKPEEIRGWLRRRRKRMANVSRSRSRRATACRAQISLFFQILTLIYTDGPAIFCKAAYCRLRKTSRPGR